MAWPRARPYSLFITEHPLTLSSSDSSREVVMAFTAAAVPWMTTGAIKAVCSTWGLMVGSASASTMAATGWVALQTAGMDFRDSWYTCRVMSRSAAPLMVNCAM